MVLHRIGEVGNGLQLVGGHIVRGRGDERGDAVDDRGAGVLHGGGLAQRGGIEVVVDDARHMLLLDGLDGQPQLVADGLRGVPRAGRLKLRGMRDLRLELLGGSGRSRAPRPARPVWLISAIFPMDISCFSTKPLLKVFSA